MFAKITGGSLTGRLQWRKPHQVISRSSNHRDRCLDLSSLIMIQNYANILT